MHLELPSVNEPNWLTKIDSNSFAKQFPLGNILQGSLYYPAAGFDGNPVAYLAGNFISFIYVDYAKSYKELNDELEKNGFKGYNILWHRCIDEQELTTSDWSSIDVTAEDCDPNKYKDYFASPFCAWYVFERSSGFFDDHGPSRFSLLYLCAEGVSAFGALYLRNKQCPAAIAIINPGTGFGLNWTEFEDETKVLGRTVLGNPVGKPQFLLYGATGGRDFYRSPCWSPYRKSLGFLGETSIHLFRSISD